MTVLPPGWWVATEFLYFFGVAGLLGGSLTYLVAVRPALRACPSGLDDAQRARMRTRVAGFLRAAAATFAVGTYGLFAGRENMASGESSVSRSLLTALSPDQLRAFLATPRAPGEWASAGEVVLVQSALFVSVAIGVIALAARPERERVNSASCLAAAAVITGSVLVAAPTSFAGETVDDLLNRTLDQLHILAGCTWVGGLLTLTLLTRRRRALGNTGLFWPGVWQRFSLLALTAVGAILVSGLWLTWKNVGSVAEMVTTEFGRFLLVKLTLVVILIAAGAYNHLLLTPAMIRSGRTDRGLRRRRRLPENFPLVVAVETVLGLGVLVIVPFLTSGSARAQASAGPAPPIDGTVAVIGLLFVATLAGSLYATYRLGTQLRREAHGPPAAVHLRGQ